MLKRDGLQQYLVGRLVVASVDPATRFLIGVGLLPLLVPVAGPLGELLDPLELLFRGLLLHLREEKWRGREAVWRGGGHPHVTEKEREST